MTQATTWNPDQYNKFRAERMQPFVDLVAMVRPRAGMRVIDLGCGTGELTAMLGGFERWTHAPGLERYAELLYEGGVAEQSCFEKIYGHVLPSTADVVEWVKGTNLNAYLSRLDDAGKDLFLTEYRARLFAAIGE